MDSQLLIDADPVPLEKESEPPSQPYPLINDNYTFPFAIPQVPKPDIIIKPFSFQKKFFKNSTKADWNNWKWHIKNRITDLHTLEHIVQLTHAERMAINKQQGRLPISITPYYASLIDPINPKHPLRRAVIPTIEEFSPSFGESMDPLGEEKDSPVPGIVHRYPDRVLFLTTKFCPVCCRYCTRSRLIQSEEQFIHWDKAIAYIAAHPEIRDVLLSGGDTFSLTDEAIDNLLKKLRAIKHVEFIRIGTKVPAALPQRITPALVKIIKKYHPIWISIHFMHSQELTEETKQACTRLADAGIPLGSQTVLLKGINDSVKEMTKLYHELLKVRVRPYYLYQCDPIFGSSHFRTTIDKGLEIIKGLRGYTSGYAVPHYVIDAPGGGGKIPLLPNYYKGKKGNIAILQNYEGEIFSYPDTATLL